TANNWIVRLSPAYRLDRTVLVAGTDGAFLSMDAGGNWRELLDGVPVCPTCPRFVNAAFSPDYANDRMLVLVSGNGGGLLSSNDARFAFNFLNTGQVGRWVLGLAFSPTLAADSTIWSGSQNNLLRTTNRGASWSEVPMGEQAATNDTASGFAYLPSVSPDGSVLLVGAQKGVLRSIDGGQTWETVDRGPCFAGTGTAFHPDFATNGIVYSIAAGCGVYRSGDAGVTWTAL